MTFSLIFGRWGGIYFHHDYTTRLCLGWMALTFYPFDMDDLHNAHREALTTMAGMMDDQSRQLARFRIEGDELRVEAAEARAAYALLAERTGAATSLAQTQAHARAAMGAGVVE